ncbi:MAG: CBS domain-containing protein [Pseudolabrys sp.]|jgi:CBS-domain-containing membrane protein
MNARDVMTRNLISIAPDATVLQAARKMLEHHISGLPVVDKGKLIGIVSEGDFLRRRETQTQRRRARWLEFLMGPGRMAEEYAHTHGSRVAEVMSTAVRSVTEDTSLEDIVGLMEKHHIKRVPVMDGAKMVGIVTRANLMHAMVGLAREAKPVKASDAAIREQLMAIMQEQTWAPTAMVDVQVHDGVVELWGTILDERQRDALKVAAETIAGVKAVKDHLAWIEPISGTIVESRNGASAH